MRSLSSLGLTAPPPRSRMQGGPCTHLFVQPVGSPLRAGPLLLLREQHVQGRLPHHAAVAELLECFPPTVSDYMYTSESGYSGTEELHDAPDEPLELFLLVPHRHARSPDRVRAFPFARALLRARLLKKRGSAHRQGEGLCMRPRGCGNATTVYKLPVYYMYSGKAGARAAQRAPFIEQVGANVCTPHRRTVLLALCAKPAAHNSAWSWVGALTPAPGSSTRAPRPHQINSAARALISPS